MQPVLRDEWDKLAKQHPDRFKAVYTLDNPPFMLWKGEPSVLRSSHRSTLIPSLTWFYRTGEKGFVTKEMITKYLPSDHNEKANTKFFVCGP
jgi:NAD(P)H-flavin reductase